MSKLYKATGITMIGSALPGLYKAGEEIGIAMTNGTLPQATYENPGFLLMSTAAAAAVGAGIYFWRKGSPEKNPVEVKGIAKIVTEGDIPQVPELDPNATLELPREVIEAYERRGGKPTIIS